MCQILRINYGKFAFTDQKTNCKKQKQWGIDTLSKISPSICDYNSQQILFYSKETCLSAFWADEIAAKHNICFYLLR